MEIEVRNLTVTFGSGRRRFMAVDDVSFSVASGSCYGIVGESGSGKSTILRALCGLERGWTGEVAFDGKRHKAGRSVPSGVQMIFQDPYGSLHPRHTINRILSEPAHVRGLGDIGGRVERALVDVGLPVSMRYRYPHQLSGGQRQRIAIARTLIVEPRVLLLDEPTSALDVSIQAEILNLLSRLRRERGLTYVLVSHNLAVIDHMSDRIAVMLGGKVVEELTTGRLADASNDYTRALVEASG